MVGRGAAAGDQPAELCRSLRPGGCRTAYPARLVSQRRRQHQRADGLSAHRVSAELHDRGADLRLALRSNESLVDRFRRRDRLEPGLGWVGPGQHVCHAARHTTVHRLWRSGVRTGGSDGAGRFVSGRAARTDSFAVLRRDSGRQRARLFAGGIHGRAIRLADGILCFAATGNPVGSRLPFPARSSPTRARGGPAEATRGQSQPQGLCQPGSNSVLRHQHARHGGHGFRPGGGRVLDAQLHLCLPPRRLTAGRRIEPPTGQHDVRRHHGHRRHFRDTVRRLARRQAARPVGQAHIFSFRESACSSARPSSCWCW